MTSLRDLLLFAVLVIALNASAGIPSVHLHRYMLSDYKPQHSHKTQKDYKPLHRPVYPEEEVASRSGSSMPMVELENTKVKTDLLHLLVRIYNGKKYLCMGTLITERLIVTSTTCLNQTEAHNLTIKTSKSVHFSHLEMSSIGNGVIKMLVLRNPMPHMNFTARLCDAILRPPTSFPLSTYIRSRRVIHTHMSNVLPLAECRTQLDDPRGHIVTDSMICVRNEKRTSSCQKTFGTPLIHNGQLCGVNVLGHNCPKYFGVDLYASIINEAQYLNATLKLLKASKINEILRK